MLDYIFLEHTTDVLIEAYGRTLEEAFNNAGRGLVDTMVDIKTIESKIKEKFYVTGKDIENLLYNWLESVLIKVTLNNKIFVSFNVKIQQEKEGFSLQGIGIGEKLNLKKHNPKTEAKSATYHLMRIKKEKNKISLRFLIDI